MRSKIISLMLLALTTLGLMGCGGGDSSSSTVSQDSTSYDFYDYLVSSNSVTKNWDNYILNSAGEITSTSINVISSTESIISSTNSIVTEDEKITYSLLSNSISASNGMEIAYLKRYLNLGDEIMTDFKFIEHLDTYSPLLGYSFNDVIKIQIDFNDGTYTYDYYAKDLGKVVTTSNYTIGTSISQGVSIVNNY